MWANARGRSTYIPRRHFHPPARMTLRLHLLRHGQTNASRGNLFCGRRLNPSLTEEGIAMAESFAAAYRDRTWSAIYSSPLSRAVTTAMPLATSVGLPVQTRDGFAEIDYGE